MYIRNISPLLTMHCPKYNSIYGNQNRKPITRHVLYKKSRITHPVILRSSSEGCCISVTGINFLNLTSNLEKATPCHLLPLVSQKLFPGKKIKIHAQLISSL